MGHARALLAINSEEDQVIQFRAIIADKLSVRAVEERVKTEKTKSTRSAKAHPSIETKKTLSDFYNTPVKIYQSENGSGKIHVNFSSEEEFQRLVKLLLNK
jgi:ParB family chromosome partitioning protein